MNGFMIYLVKFLGVRKELPMNRGSSRGYMVLSLRLWGGEERAPDE